MINSLIVIIKLKIPNNIGWLVDPKRFKTGFINIRHSKPTKNSNLIKPNNKPNPKKQNKNR